MSKKIFMIISVILTLALCFNISSLTANAEVVAEVVPLLALQDVLWIGGQGIPGDMADHVSDHEIGIDLMALHVSPGGSHELVVKGSGLHLGVVFHFRNGAGLCPLKILVLNDA